MFPLSHQCFSELPSPVKAKGIPDAARKVLAVPAGLYYCARIIGYKQDEHTNFQPQPQYCGQNADLLLDLVTP